MNTLKWSSTQRFEKFIELHWNPLNFIKKDFELKFNEVQRSWLKFIEYQQVSKWSLTKWFEKFSMDQHWVNWSSGYPKKRSKRSIASNEVNGN